MIVEVTEQTKEDQRAGIGATKFERQDTVQKASKRRRSKGIEMESVKT